MTSGSQFRQAGPARLSRRTWARDYNEVREFGRIDSDVRTADQTHAANFWIENPHGGSVDDGSAATPLDPTWLPLNTTPGHPEYPCAHCELSAAGSVG